MRVFLLKNILPGIFVFLMSCTNSQKQEAYTGNELSELNTALAKGWNTWNTRSVLSHVFLPDAFSLNLQLKHGSSGAILEEALIGRHKKGAEHVIPGPHAYDGSYTELEIEWREIQLQIQSATVENKFYLLVTSLGISNQDSLIISPQMLWDFQGKINLEQENILAQTPNGNINLKVLGNKTIRAEEKLVVALDKTLAITGDKDAKLADVQKIIQTSKSNFLTKKSKYSNTPELYNSMQSVLAWDIIYEPTNNRVIAPVSRIWNCQWAGGWILFDWDTYFAAYMFSLDNKELAYSNAIAVTKGITKGGFIPGFNSGLGKTEDRSQPPVGSFIINEIYNRYGEKWLLHETFDELLSWNRWWEKNRDIDGYLVWGSDPYDAKNFHVWLKKPIGRKVAAMWESGLDNSPMFDDAVMDSTTHRLLLADVGLMSFYVHDCQNLSQIARILDKPEIVKELIEREKKYTQKLETLWDEETGLYLNKDLISGKLSQRISPTMFYPLLAKVPTQERAERMINEHFYNPEEFWGDYIIPSISRNDSSYKDNTYWRGRIWGPMNFLVYLGIINYDLPSARKDMVNKSEELLMQSWTTDKYIYENYNAETGQGDDVKNSDKFYHWGALLGFIKILDEGYAENY